MGITFASAIQHMSKTADCHSSTNMHAFIEFSSQYHSVDPTMPSRITFVTPKFNHFNSSNYNW